MTIKQQGGIFGRNPAFNNVEVTGTLTAEGSISVPADSISGDAINGGTTTPDGLAVGGNVLFVDSVNNRVGINTSTVDDALHIEGSLSGDIMGLKIQNNNLDANSRAGIKMATANGTWTFASSRSGGCALIAPSGEAWTTNNYGNLAFPSGQGIDFSATSGSGTSELFDDYEEGVWSPDLRDGASGSVFASQANDGVYVKCGSMVWASAALFGASTSSSTNIVTINLPFAASSSKTNAAAPLVYSVGLGSAVAAYVQDGGSYLKFTKTIGSIGSNVLCNEVTTGLRGYFSIVYSTV